MKLLIASDIHGSAYWCEKLVDAFKKENANKLVLLGDILYHGPRNPLPKHYSPKDVADMLNRIADKIIAVRGNCDSEVDQMVLNFNISADCAEIWDGCDTKITVSHGHHVVPPLGKGDVYITGHTHVPLNCVENAGYTHLNPGSVSLPKENSHQGYILYDNGKFTFKDFNGNVIEI